MEDFPKRYDPTEIEPKWLKVWENKHLFSPKVPTPKKIFSIVVPPPNVTGQLHLGHVFNNTIQDTLIRYKKLNGYEVLWLPGMDHAGIATQVVVEEKLAEKCMTRQSMGRAAFVKAVWHWKERYSSVIREQFKRMGCSLDWTREKFTLDEDLSKTVIKVFVALYNKKLIYRGKYIINWCPRCLTALSDEQVEDIKEAGKLYYIRYPFEGSDEHIVVATTRPETMLGDTAVCVHPDDERYRDKIGKVLALPLMNRKIPLVADTYVDPAFGTGALKVTPAHDKFDFELARKHLLEVINIMNDDASINENGGAYQGLDRTEARIKVVEDLKQQNFIEKIENYEIPLGRCERCETPIEPRISLQWFVKMKPLAEPALEAVHNGTIKIFPERWTNLYNHWMENIRDWCISRQLWWGHRIPVYYCLKCLEGKDVDEIESTDRGIMVAEEKPTKCQTCDSTDISQDEDVLDTWFSSWLWPFTTLGWPEKTADYKTFYPTSTLVSGWDIIYLWVARMIMAGLEFTDQVPFHEVCFHGMIRDGQGRKMSKSLGNSPEPIDIIDKFGADALRFGIQLITPKDRDVLFSEERIATGRNFANKLWNSGRFLWLNTRGLTPGLPRELKPIDKWIIAKFGQLIDNIERYLKYYELNQAAKALYDFTWHDYCDWYVEYMKAETRQRGQVFDVGFFVFKNLLILLHPFMPFITEELYQRLNCGTESIFYDRWPDRKTFKDSDTAAVDLLLEAIESIRNLRSVWRIPANKKTDCILKIEDKNFRSVVEANITFLKVMASVDNVYLDQKPQKPFASFVLSGVDIHIPLSHSAKIEKEIKRLKDELKFLDSRIIEIENRLGDQQFQKMAAEEVKIRETNRLSEFSKKKDNIIHLLETIEQ